MMGERDKERAGSVTSLRVGYYGNMHRLVVYDPSVQPRNERLMTIYSVHGHMLCVRDHTVDVAKISDSVPSDKREFALTQYRQWASNNARLLESKRDSIEIDELPPQRTQCPECDGTGIWMDPGKSASWRGAKEDENVSEVCDRCRGDCSVEDFL